MYKVYVGTKNPVKLEAVQQILKKYDVIGKQVDSQVGSQPLNDDDTIRGALMRARALPSGFMRVGLEAGVQQHGNTLYLVNWGVLIDEKDNTYYAGGTRIPLPDFVRDKIFTEKKELADVMDSYYHTVNIKHKEGSIGFFTNNLVKRVDIFTHIMKLLYGQYLSKKEEINA